MMRRSVGVAVLVAAILLPLTIVVRVSSSGGDSTTGWSQAGFVLVLLVLAAAVFVAVRDLIRVFGGADPQASAIAARLAERPEQRVLLGRWLRRSRWYRNVGGTTGVLAGLFIGGIGGIVLVGLIGVTIGSLAAEVHLLRPDRVTGARPKGPRVAGLERRSLARYWEPPRQLALTILGLVAACLLLVNRFGPAIDGLRQPWAAGIVVIVAGAMVIQWRVAIRPRPALPESLRSSDDLVRSLAITSGIANPAITLALAFLGQALYDVSTPLSVVAWLAALSLFWRFRRLGFDHLLDEPPLESPVAVA